MNVRWTGKASADLVRLYEHLRPVAPGAAARIIRQLARAPDRLNAPEINVQRQCHQVL